jgi:hypothetical protein
MKRIEINICEKIIVRQVGYLQELNRDARSTEHKKYKRNLAYNSVRGGGKSTMGIRYSHDSILRPVRFFPLFLSVHHPNNHSKNVSIFLICPSST